MATFQNVHRFTRNLQGLKIMVVESFPSSTIYWGADSFWETSKTIHNIISFQWGENYFSIQHVKTKPVMIP